MTGESFMVYGKDDSNSGLKFKAANFFCAPQQGTTDPRRADSAFRTIDDPLASSPHSNSEVNSLSVRFS